MTASRDRARRTKVELPHRLVEPFRVGVAAGGVSGSTIVYGWITQAARYARQGRYDLVPPQSSTPSTSGDQDPIYYPMSRAESEDVVGALRDAGSSVRAVAAACIEAYLAADCSTVRMTWPRREARAAA